MTTSSIRSSGGDYTSISGWIAGEQGAITEATIGEMYNDWTGDGLEEAASISISGFSGNSITNYIELRAANGEGHDGTFDSGTRMYSSQNNAFNVQEQYFYLTGIQCNGLGSTNHFILWNANNGKIDSCLFKGNGSTSSYALGVVRLFVADNSIVQNNLFTGFISGRGISVEEPGCNVYHNDVDGSDGLDYGVYATDYTTLDLSLNAVYNCATSDYFASGTIGSGDYNADSDGSLGTYGPGANDFTLTGDPWTDSSNGDYTHGASSELTDAGGTSGAGVTADCIGTVRPQNTNYDVGWFEFVSGGSILPNKLNQSQTLDNINLVQQHTLVVQSIDQSQTLDNIDLIQQHTVTIQAIDQSQTLDNIELTVGALLEIADIAQNQSADQIVLVQQHTLNVNGIDQSQTLDNIDLLQQYSLDIQALEQSQTSDNITLDAAVFLDIAAILQGQTLDNINLLQQNILAIQALEQAQDIQNIVISVGDGIVSIEITTRSGSVSIDTRSGSINVTTR